MNALVDFLKQNPAAWAGVIVGALFTTAVFSNGGVSLGTTRVCAGQEELVEAVDKLAEGVDSLQDGVQSLKTDMRATREGIDHISQEEETLIRITELMCIYLAATQNERDACGIG